ncbi:MAG TPA: alginate lyase family protein, partial [Candidatus Hydrogenedentes bacterium]|nr:alginate lyase family protein [Candidatus Hydrogenedentota bacterium]
SASEWAGATLDTTLKKSGVGSLTWDLSRVTSTRMNNAPKDWSTHNTLRFWVHNKKPGPYYFFFIVFSENESTQGPDYYAARVMLDFQGWRQFHFPRKQMSGTRSPLGWDQISSVMISTSWGDQKIDPTMQFHLDEVQLMDTEKGRGPLLSDEEMFDAFDLAREGMEQVRAAAEAGDHAVARRALAEYMRTRRAKTWFFSPHDADRQVRYNKDRADKAVEGEVEVSRVTHQFPGGKMDWAFNATDKRKDMAYNPEWQWQLGRMAFWSDLGDAYWATGDEKYAKAFVEQMRGWVRDCPMPATVQNGRKSSWRTIECGIRMANAWPRALHRFLLSPHFTDDAIIEYIKSSIEHGRYLDMYPSRLGNWLALETQGLYTIGVVFPELKDAKKWRATGVERMVGVLRDQLLPDGWQYEIATGYSQMTVGLTLNVYRRAHEFGYADELPPDYAEAMEKSYNMTLYFAAPDRRQPAVNDAGLGNAQRTLAAITDLFPHRQDFLWLATDGAQGSPPEHTSYAFDHAGYFCMRSSWNRQANYLMLDAGPLGMAHVHQDKLNLSLWVWGRYMLLDNGGYTYDESKWRRYGVSAYSHNTVLVDGLGQERDRMLHRKLTLEGPVDARWETTDAYDFASGYYDEGYGKVDNNIAKHTRRVLFVKPDLFVVSDTLESRDGQPHEYAARWHMHGAAPAKND